MRRAGVGVVYNIAGIATYNGSANAGLYCASKSAISTLTEALQSETDPLGIRVCLVQLGHFRTPFLTRGHRRRVAGHIVDYDAVLNPYRTAFNNLNGVQPGDPEKAAQILVELAIGEIENIPPSLALGSDVPVAMQKSHEARLNLFKKYEPLTNSTDL